MPALGVVLERARRIVKLEDFIIAYNTIFEEIPAFYSLSDLERLPKHRLLSHMLAVESGASVEVVREEFVRDVVSNPRVGNPP